MFPKGSYLIKEGTAATQDSKFYLIQQGECIVEKNVSINLSSPRNGNKVNVQNNTQTAQIAVIGRFFVD